MFILELVYGCWTLFKNFDEEILQIKDMQYGTVTLFILLDNYIPLVLSINSLTFKLNNNLQSTSDHGSEYMSEQTSLQQSTTGVDKHVFSLGEHSPLLITSYVTISQ